VYAIGSVLEDYYPVELETSAKDTCALGYGDGSSELLRRGDECTIELESWMEKEWIVEASEDESVFVEQTIHEWGRGCCNGCRS